MPLIHAQDEDCRVDPATDLCRDCSTHHGEPCPECQGRAFHRADCPST